MKKLLTALAILGVAGLALGEEFKDNVNFRGEVNYDSGAIWKIKGTTVSASADQINNAASGILTGLTCTGKATINGELEVNDDVDINLATTNDFVDITQTNVTGKPSQPLIKITDARTGTSANGTDEATLVIEAAGSYSLVANGIAQFADVMATSLEGALGGDGASITNLDADNVASGTLDNDRLDSDLQALAVNDGGALTNLNGVGIQDGTVPRDALATAVQTSLGKADSALQPNTVVVTGVTNGVDTAVLTVTNGLGAASTIVGIWSATSNGAASTDNLISLVATTGTLLSSTNSGTIVVITDSTGYAALTATVSAATTNYAAFIQNNGVRKSSAEMVFDGP
jgi:hypothetical protein